MFDELMRELKRLERGQRIPVTVACDDEGYLDRKCPSTECQFHFKVHNDDWRDKVPDDKAFCPFCGHAEGSGEWCTPEQAEHLRKQALAHLDRRIGVAMKRDADNWNRRQPRNSFISMTMSVNSRPQLISLPPAAADPMRLKITCPACACRYAVIGAAFFCPACGHNAADLMFSQTVSGIRNVLDALSNVRDAISDRDTADTTVRHIIENGLQNAVTAFQRYAEALYSRFPSQPAPRRNAFQNLKEGSDLWNGATGRPYSAYLSNTEQAAIGRYFQQRHLLAHRQGLVDDDYVARTGDNTYRPGQRLVVREAAVRECLGILEKLTAAMSADSKSPQCF